MSLEQLTSFIGWCSVQNIVFLLFSAVFLIGISEQVSERRPRLFKLKTTNWHRHTPDILPAKKF